MTQPGFEAPIESTTLIPGGGPTGELYDLIYRDELPPARLTGKLVELERQHGEVVYTHVLHVLSHLHFESADARAHWHAIVKLHATMEEHGSAPVDLRVAVVSHFLKVNQQLRSPKIVEVKLIERPKTSTFPDELTGLHNYDFFVECVTQEVRRSHRFSTPASLLMLDVDDFKQYNDTNGGAIGSQALATIAHLLVRSLRKLDVPARYSGEEFAILLPCTPKVGAEVVAERTRKLIENHPFASEETQPGGKLTVSVGVATYPADARDAEELIERASRAMRIAKSYGKNQVHLHGHSCRSFRRIPASLKGSWRTLGAEPRPLTTLDVGEGGMLFRAERELPVGALLELLLVLPDGSAEIAFAARVLQVESRAPDDYEVAVSFVAAASRDQNLLARFVRESTPLSDADDPGTKLLP